MVFKGRLDLGEVMIVAKLRIEEDCVTSVWNWPVCNKSSSLVTDQAESSDAVLCPQRVLKKALESGFNTGDDLGQMGREKV